MPVKKCALCEEEINIEAKKCPYCESFQSSIKRNFIFYGSIVGIFSLVSTSFFFIRDAINIQVKRFNPIEITKYYYNEGIVFQNRSFDKLFISSIVVEANKNKNLKVYKEIIDLPINSRDVTVHKNRKYPYLTSPEAISEEEWNLAWDDNSNCFDIFFGIDLLDGDRLTQSAEATLYYINTYNGKLKSKSFEVNVYLKLKDNKICSQYGNPKDLFYKMK